MQIITDINTILSVNTVVAIGKFDGFHMGHTKLFDISRVNKKEGHRLLVFTFSSPQNSEAEALLTRQEKLSLAERLGADIYLECPFTEEVRRTDAQTFLREILLNRFKMKYIVAGTDCSFGYKGAGNAELLSNNAAVLGYGLSIVDKVLYKGDIISSTRIKKAIKDGEINDANSMLGYSYSLSGTVMAGRQNGRRLGFPTINMPLQKGKTVPRYGVYISRTLIGTKSWYGMTNIGVKPTVSACEIPNMETHLFGAEGDLYGQSARIELIDFLRPEQAFSSLDELSKQLAADKAAALDRIGAY